MSRGTRIWVSLPDELLAQLDQCAHGAGLSRADAVLKAVEAYVVRTRREGLKVALARGYRDMAEINLAMALDDEGTLTDTGEYERLLSEADRRGDP